jgi:hypothetical protein
LRRLGRGVWSVIKWVAALAAVLFLLLSLG